MTFDWKKAYAPQIDALITYSALAWQRGMAGGTGGNISFRAGEHVVVTTTNVPLRAVTPDKLILCDLSGRVLDAAPGERPSKETGFHAAVYAARADVTWVAHLHPVYAIAWGLTGDELPLLTESARLKLGPVPLIPVGRPGSAELAQAVSRVVEQNPASCAYLLREHGVITVGASAADCWHTCELLEDSAKIAVLARMMKV